MRELALLERIRRSPFGGSWLRGARLRIDAGTPVLWSTDRVVLHDGAPVDAVIACTVDDLDRMLSRQDPEGQVVLSLGDRDLPDRVKQARGVLAAAALGWCGPWPNPVAGEHVELVRKAVLDLAVGPGDATGALFPAEAGLDLRFRRTDGARVAHCTLGLAETHGVEFVTTGGLAGLRAAALATLRLGRCPRSISLGERRLHLTPRPMPLPTRLGWLVSVEAG